jgi:hypothetical protein
MANLALLARRDPASGSLVFVPSRADDVETLRRMRVAPGDELRAKFKRARNPLHHRRVFALINFVFQNQERFDGAEALRCFLTLHTSFCHAYQDQATGAVFRVPRSWAYDEMDEEEFTKLHEELIPVILREFMPGMSAGELVDAAAQNAFMDGVAGFV